MKNILSIALLSATLVASNQLAAFSITGSPAVVCHVSDPTGTPLNVRARPNGRIIGSLSNGTRVTVEGSSGRWTKVATGDMEGYVLSAYLDDCRAITKY